MLLLIDLELATQTTSLVAVWLAGSVWLIIPVFKTTKTRNFNFSMNLSNCNQIARFSKSSTGLRVLKKVTKHCQINLPTSDLPRKKKKRRRRRRRIDNCGRETTNLLLAFPCICICFFVCWKNVKERLLFVWKLRKSGWQRRERERWRL